VDKGKFKAFLKNRLQKKVGESFSMNRKQLRIMTGILTGHCHLKGYFFNYLNSFSFLRIITFNTDKVAPV